MRCNKCGAEIFEGELYCGECGTKLHIQNNVQQNNYNPYGKKKSKGFKIFIIVILVIIAILVILGFMEGIFEKEADTTNTQNLPNNNNSSLTNTNNQNTNYNQNTMYNNNSSTNTNNTGARNEIINNGTSTNNQTTTNNQANVNEQEFKKDNEKAYTKYCLLFDNGETYNDIYIEIEGRNIYLFDNESEMSYTGTYTSSNGYLTGTYTEVSYNNGGDIERETINDSFKFEILPNHKLKDILGYGQWCQQVKGRNNTFMLY